MDLGHDRAASLEAIDLDHELDDYINDWTFEFDSPHISRPVVPPGLIKASDHAIEETSFPLDDPSSQFFDEAFYLELPEHSDAYIPDADETFGAQFEIPDSLIDPRLRDASRNPRQRKISQRPMPPLPPHSPIRSASKRFVPPTTTCWFGRKLLRKSKKDESTYDHSPESKLPILDQRLYEHVKRDSLPFKYSIQTTTELRCAPPTAAPIYPLDPLVDDRMEHDGSNSMEVSQEYLDSFLSSLSADALHDTNMLDFLEEVDAPDTIGKSWASTPDQTFQVIDKDEFTWRMLAPSAPLVQPSEKRKRGRPKKDEVEESHQAAYYMSAIPFHTSADIVNTITQPPERQIQAKSPTVPGCSTPLPAFQVATPLHLPSQADSDNGDEEEPFSKRRRITINGGYRSMSKKEQAYLEMDSKVKLYDETNIHELLYFPSLRAGRTACFWIQRHPYANTKIYEDHYRTWCRYRHCRGVETSELIRTATGEMREKNYKHPRTIIAGNYQVAVDWEYVEDEIETFKDNPNAQYEYDKRNVYDNVECFFHLRCFEMLTNFPQVVRQYLVKVDHRVLNKDKSRNKITKRKNKGGTNAAEIEWYLKDEAAQWMQRVRDDLCFNPHPGSEESLEKVLLNGKKTYNEKKGTNKLVSTLSRTQSPAL
ncbi:hypothetical protein Dda_2249 [Drechslerella dactyloides]|uniref:Uncharacterized protein n=1 Tax=Drechslerella dactyloides TaxID=74499 RepID=A0AAD6NMU7_DREDA|nr:hypothetical protein Dda_2249 [Drechslerella dactyloides]